MWTNCERNVTALVITIPGGCFEFRSSIVIKKDCIAGDWLVRNAIYRAFYIRKGVSTVCQAFSI